MSHCAVHSCKTSVYNKPPGVILHPCPQSQDIRNKWLLVLKNKCPMIDWNTSKICSKHFENRYFDSQRKLKENAIPTIFFNNNNRQISKTLGTEESKVKIDKMLNNVTHGQLMTDIKFSLLKLGEPKNLTEFLTHDFQIKPDSPTEAKLWLLIKKQENLNKRLMDLVVKNKNNVVTTQKSFDELKNSKKELEKNVETYKYIVKCLQEKQATLEEQIEILSSVESR